MQEFIEAKVEFFNYKMYPQIKLGMKFHVPSLHRYSKLVGHVLEFLLYHDIEEGPNDGKDHQNIPSAMEYVVPCDIHAFLQHGTTSSVSICWWQKG